MATAKPLKGTKAKNPNEQSRHESGGYRSLKAKIARRLPPANL